MLKKIERLKKITKQVKISTLKMLNQKGGGHYGGSFSCAEILVNIFFSQMKSGNKFILSKAHAGVIFNAVLAKKKIIHKNLIRSYGKENSKLGVPILVGKEDKIKEQIKSIGYNENFDIEIVNSKDNSKREKYAKYLFKKLQREQGMLERDCDRLI